MGLGRCRYVAGLVAFGVAVLAGRAMGSGLQAAQAPATPHVSAPVPAPTAPSKNTYPQIVRIRYLEGDVRVARGKDAEKQTDAEWEQAEADLPLASGFTLVTATGRAEIEFEDSSTLYLGENSALSLDDLQTTWGTPQSVLTLLTGTMTVRVKPTLAGESFVVKTPTDSLSTSYPEKAYLRITSFLDAIAVTPLKDESFQVTGATAQQGAKGQTTFYSNGKTVAPEGNVDPAAFTEWDTWVANRVAMRAAASAAVAEASGLGASVPGIADMYGQGTFFACKPYGTCWEPPADEDVTPGTDAAPQITPAAMQTAAPIVRPDFALSLSRTSVSTYAGGKVSTKVSVVNLSAFSDAVNVTTDLPAGITCVAACGGQITPGQPLAMQFLVGSNVQPGTYDVAFAGVSGGLTHAGTLKIYVVAQAEADVVLPFTPAIAPWFPCVPDGLPPALRRDVGARVLRVRRASYGWAVCHTGAWIFRSNVYLWVPSRRRHHHRPVRWVKSKKVTGYVPLHPRDVSGQPAYNRKHDLYSPADKSGLTVERLRFDPKDKIEDMKDPPKDFRKPYLPVLAKADTPTIGAHDVKEGFGAKGVGSTLVFDNKTRSFLIQRTDGEQGKAVKERFSDHQSSLQSRGGGVVARGTHNDMRTGATHTGAPHTAATHTTASHTASHASGGHAGGGHAGGGGHSGGGSHSAGGGHH